MTQAPRHSGDLAVKPRKDIPQMSPKMMDRYQTRLENSERRREMKGPLQLMPSMVLPVGGLPIFRQLSKKMEEA
jgi:hypothetical protein